MEYLITIIITAVSGFALIKIGQWSCHFTDQFFEKLHKENQEDWWI